MHEPKHYSLPDHLARIFESKEFADAAKRAGRTFDAFRHDVEKELKKLVEEHRAAELRAFEEDLAPRALAAIK